LIEREPLHRLFIDVRDNVVCHDPGRVGRDLKSLIPEIAHRSPDLR
jgi:hypothetical protein